MQRFLDILFSGLALLLLAPLMLPIMLLLRLTGEGEVFYVQERVGLGQRPFGLLKFATMLKESPKIGAGEITVKNDPRILPVGRFLRRTKLNELPQLINILRGDMSLVGPRPMVPNTFAHYAGDARRELCTVRPGLTGVGSILFRDEERYLDGLEDPAAFYREVIIPYKTELERWYIRRRSVGLYLLLIFLTAWVVVFPRSELPERVLRGLPERPAPLQLA